MHAYLSMFVYHCFRTTHARDLHIWYTDAWYKVGQPDCSTVPVSPDCGFSLHCIKSRESRWTFQKLFIESLSLGFDYFSAAYPSRSSLS